LSPSLVEAVLLQEPAAVGLALFVALGRLDRRAEDHRRNGLGDGAVKVPGNARESGARIGKERRGATRVSFACYPAICSA